MSIATEQTIQVLQGRSANCAHEYESRTATAPMAHFSPAVAPSFLR